jgi:hypothetical protein
VTLKSHIALASLLACIILGGVITCSADAQRANWRARGRWITPPVQLVGTSLAGAWTENRPGGRVYACRLVDRQYLYFGRFRTTSWRTECELIYQHKSCTTATQSGTVPWEATLIEREGKFYGLIEGIKLKIQNFGEACTIEGESEVTGNLEGAWNNTTHEFEFPETPLSGSTLKDGSEEIVFSGDDKFELEPAGTLEIGEETEKEENEEKEKMGQQEKAGPHWNVGGTRLVAGKTHNFAARATKPFVLTNTLGTDKVECSGLSTQEGVLLGTNPVNPGKSSITLVYSGCVNAAGSNGSACHLAPSEGSAETATTIRTEPLRSEQVESVVAGTKGSQLLEEVFPAKGAVFATLFFGGECTILATKVSGQVVGETTLDNASEGTVELGEAAQERASWLIRFPATPITEVWLISEGAGRVRKTEQTAFGEKSIETGTALLLLAGTKYAAEPSASWSPLP